ncbi:MAG: hypothetical protein ACOZQL_26765 [Myxococcota bacterium]
MPIDPKIRTGVPVIRTNTTPLNQPTPRQPTAPATTITVTPPSGFKTLSSFETIGRRGTSDDSVGRGTFDDSVGRNKGTSDDGVGRNKGTSDDGVGRKKGTSDDGVGRKKGTSDDGVGGFEAARAALVGRTDTPDANALRTAIYERLETPTFLKHAGSAATQVFDFAQKNLKLSSAQMGQLTTALKGASKEATALMGALLEKAPEALSTVDSKGQTLLSNLAKFAAQPLNPKVAAGTTKEELFTSMLRDVVNPNRIDQGDAPTCTVTSMQFELVADDPAEYTRLMTELTGPNGRARMRGGSELVVQDGDVSTTSRDGRPASQALFQTVCMEFGNGRNLEFDPLAKGSLDAAGKLVQRGLKPEQQTQVLRQLFGVNYRSELFQTEAEGAKVLEKLRGYDARGNQNRPVILQLDQGNFNHAVTFERVADNRVYFRDPYGELRSMPEEQFKTFVVGMNAPKDLGIIG